MENYRFVTIGIRRYRFLPPLGGSESCLEELQQYLQQKIAIPEKQTLLFTERRFLEQSPRIYPNGNNLRKALSRHCQGIFFQGYASQRDGEDYLLPIDAKTDNLHETAIPFRLILESLKYTRSVPAWLLLDVVSLDLTNPISNRGLLEAKALGINIVARFNPMGSEPGDLGQTFLKALRYYEQSLNLELLELYLRDQIPSRYGNEFLIILNGLKNDPLMPFFPSAPVLARVFSPWHNRPRKVSFGTSVKGLPVALSLTQNSRKLISVVSISLGLLIIVTGLVVFILHRLIAHKQSPEQALTLQTVSPQMSEVTRLEQAKSYLQWQQASVFVRAIAELRKIPSHSPNFKTAQEQISLWSQIILAIAEGRAQVGNWQDAIAAAKLVPGDQPKLYEQAQQLIKQSQVKEQEKSSF